MKKLNYKEFNKRMIEIAKAEKIFIPHITKNVSKAFAIYQELLAEEKMPVFVSTEEFGSKTMSPFDELIRPRCDECDSELGLRSNVKDSKGIIHATAWICVKCGMEYYSDKTMQEWYTELKNEDRKQNSKPSD